MSQLPKPIRRRDFLKGSLLGAIATATPSLLGESAPEAGDALELQIDHVMFPVYHNDAFLDEVREIWKGHNKVDIVEGGEEGEYKGVYFRSKRFYVEHLSTSKGNTYWSNNVYVIVSKEHWGRIKNPAKVFEHILIPSFACGYQLVSPEFPYLNSKISQGVTYDGFTLLISAKLEKDLLNLCGLKWKWPTSLKVKVHEGLLHPYDMAVIDEGNTLIAPLYQSNFGLKEYW